MQQNQIVCFPTKSVLCEDGLVRYYVTVRGDQKMAGADPGFLERGFICIKLYVFVFVCVCVWGGGGGRFAGFISFCLNIP